MSNNNLITFQDISSRSPESSGRPGAFFIRNYPKFTGMEYQLRTYRQQFNPARFASFTVQYLETDLWIGVDHASFHKEIAEVALHEVMDLRTKLDAYIHEFPAFGASLEPLKLFPGALPEAREMAAAGTRSGTGPMAAVAGLFALRIAEKIRKRFPLKELIVENGGDYYLLLKEDLLMTIYAGDSPLSEKIGILIPAGDSPCGVCTSSGTVGPSSVSVRPMPLWLPAPRRCWPTPGPPPWPTASKPPPILNRC